MNATEKFTEATQQKPMRLWPGVIIVILQWLLRFVIPAFFPDALMFGVLGIVVFGLALIVWWVFYSRVPRFERWFAIVLMIVALVVTSQVLDKSIATANMGLMFAIFSIPVMCLALVVWAVASRRLSVKLQRITLVATIILASGFWAFLRTDGMDAEIHHEFAWRWAPTAEERLLAQSDNKQNTLASDSIAKTAEAEWPGFRGRNRDGIIRSVQIETDWKKLPPTEMWRRAIGPGCSSFAVQGNLLYTQEQRGENEMVTCYNLNTGEPVWSHDDSARFWDAHAGAGPRSTPTLANNRVYTLGATGILNVLDANTGKVVWSRNAATDAGITVLPWGFTSSPLVVNDLVIVALSGKLAAYDMASGEPRWFGPDGGNSYSSPHLVTIDGISQVLLMSKAGAISMEPTSGKQLWNYEWPLDDRILQPAVTAEGDLLLAMEITGVRRVHVSHDQDNWAVKELWTSTEMKLNFNDFIIHKGYAYGFDGPSMACIDIKDGKRTWKGQRYTGWLLLLADQDVFLVLTEKGDLALVEANPREFKELARIPAIKGKTWNHPILVGDVLLVRNALEMAAFRLALAVK